MSQPPPGGEWPPNGQQPSGPPPYGQQPNQPNQPNQPPYGQQPSQPSQPPYGQQPSGPPPYGQSPDQPPYGQQPKRSRLPLIIGIAVAAIVVIGGGLFGAFALFGGDDNGDNGGSGDAFEASSETVEGDGYSYPLPQDWSDLTDDLDSAQTSAGIDTFAGEGDDVDQPQSNLLVEVDDLPGEIGFEDVRDQWQENIASAMTEGEIDELDDITIDGEDAIGVRSTGENAAGVDVTQVAYLALVDDKAYTIALSYETEDSDEYEGYLTGLLDEWSWE